VSNTEQDENFNDEENEEETVSYGKSFSQLQQEKTWTKISSN
jgi:hypothetical protein